MPKQQPEPTVQDIRARWRITGMTNWDQDFVDAEGPGFIEFAEDGRGKLHFGHISCSIDWRSDERNSRTAFTFEGYDEMSPTSGRGWARVLPDGALKGHVSFHHGDDSAFQARRD